MEWFQKQSAPPWLKSLTVRRTSILMTRMLQTLARQSRQSTKWSQVGRRCVIQCRSTLRYKTRSIRLFNIQTPLTIWIWRVVIILCSTKMLALQLLNSIRWLQAPTWTFQVQCTAIALLRYKSRISIVWQHQGTMIQPLLVKFSMSMTAALKFFQIFLPLRPKLITSAQ